MAERGAPETYDGIAVPDIARMLGLPHLLVLDSVPSTMDVAHELAQAQAAAGTLVLAEEQTAGRGRQGKSWASARGAGIWMTIVERPADPNSVEVLSLRVGLAAAAALRHFTPAPVALKWPNDLYAGGGKLAGILIEARWIGHFLDYVLVGFGVNLAPSGDAPRAGTLAPGSRRAEVLARLVPALRHASAQSGYLTEDELREFHEIALGIGARCREPAPGRVAGISPLGELLVEDDRGTVTRHRTGSLALEEAP